jgi:MYXO-CTERM domain-containing protein
MVSVSGSAIALTAPNFFEASWMHKRNGIYYFSYSANPSAGMSIDYMTSDSPTGGFVHRGTVAGQPPRNDNNNNHAGEFEFGGQWYHAYHNREVATAAGIPTGYRRSLGLEELHHEQDGTIREVAYTTDGLPQLTYVNPYVRVEAETMNAQSGVETEPASDGGMDVSQIGDGDWIRIRGVDFGAGAEGFSARVASAESGGTIELRLGSLTGSVIGTCTVSATGGWQTWTTQTTTVTGASGIADLYLVFHGTGSTLFNVDWWQFTGSGDPGGTGGTGSSGGASSGGEATTGGSTHTGGVISATGGVSSSGGVGTGGGAGTGGATSTGGVGTGSQPATGSATSTGGSPECPSPLTDCSGTCVNLASSAEHCGFCDVSCGALEVCRSGGCSTETCPASLTECGAICVDTATSAIHCGACDVPCAPGAVCSGGHCSATCATGLHQCGQSCVDFLGDPANCGRCGGVCSGGQSCESGVCVDSPSTPATGGDGGCACTTPKPAPSPSRVGTLLLVAGVLVLRRQRRERR